MNGYQIAGFTDLPISILSIIFGANLFSNARKEQKAFKEHKIQEYPPTPMIEQPIPPIFQPPQPANYKPITEEQEKKMASVRIDRIKKMMRVSNRLKFDTMASALEMDMSTFNKNIFDWADQFGFRIDGDNVIFTKEAADDFIKMLDIQFKNWENKEIAKEGKI